MKDFFISYSHPDAQWAEWIAWELDSLGYSVLMQKWHFRPGSNFPAEMHVATKECQKLLLVLSKHSLISSFVIPEWTAFFVKDPVGTEKLLIPIRVDDCKPDGLLGSIVYINLFGLTEEEAQIALHDGLKIAPYRPSQRPLFPGSSSPLISGPQFPGSCNSSVTDASINMLRSYLGSKAGCALPTIRQRALGRTFIEYYLESLVDSELSANRTISVISIDIDGMSRINKTHGVEIGDAVLERVLQLCEGLLYRLVVGRMGDDTIFVIVSSPGPHDIYRIASRAVKRVAGADWTAVAHDLYVRGSAGFAKFTNDEYPFDTVLRAIHGQLCAKQRGGNCVVDADKVFLIDKERAKQIKMPRRMKQYLNEWPIS